ncbi:MAG: DUF86 domain-containing protein [Truepera sp.]|nr:DUF86 domain-containing protein [Truepera sp.]
MTRPEVLRRRIAHLEANLRVLRGLTAYTLDDFLASPERYGAAERFLQLAIEAVNDMAAHLAADEDWGSFERTRDLVEIFYRRGLVDQELAERWRRMIGFRNLLVHEYLELDRRRVYRVLQENLGYLEALSRVFVRFL